MRGKIILFFCAMQNGLCEETLPDRNDDEVWSFCAVISCVPYFGLGETQRAHVILAQHQNKDKRESLL